MSRIICIVVILFCIPQLLELNKAQAFFYAEENEKSEETPSSETDEGAPNQTKSIQRSEIDIVKPISTFKQHNNDLTHYLSTSKTQSINTDEHEYIIVEATSNTQSNKGVAILMPDWQNGLTNPKAMNFLRKSLPNKGWSVISVQSLNKPYKYPSSALTLKDRQEQNKAALMPYTNELKSLLVKVMDKAKNYPGIILTISEGSQATILMDLYKNNSTLAPTAVVSLSGGILSTVENENFAKNIAQSPLPFLDLLLKNDSSKVIQNASLRKKYSVKEMKHSYRQKTLQNIHSGYYPEYTLLSEIIGWLKTIGW